MALGAKVKRARGGQIASREHVFVGGTFTVFNCARSGTTTSWWLNEIESTLSNLMPVSVVFISLSLSNEMRMGGANHDAGIKQGRSDANIVAQFVRDVIDLAMKAKCVGGPETRVVVCSPYPHDSLRENPRRRELCAKLQRLNSLALNLVS